MGTSYNIYVLVTLYKIESNLRLLNKDFAFLSVLGIKPPCIEDFPASHV